MELRQGKVRFSWNNGGGMASVEHDAEIKAETSLISETERWYKVIAERYVHQALTVNLEIFATILFLRIALKDIFVTLKIRD